MKRKNLVCGILLFTTILTACGSQKVDSTEPAYYEYPASVAYSTGADYCYEPAYSESYAKNSVADCYEYPEYFEPGNFNTEEYSSIKESSFLKTLTSPLSTFAADVDTASYANFRRMVNSGYKLNDFPSGAIRTEEMINYFKYDYAKPEGDEPFGVTAVVGDCPWNADVKLLNIGITTNDMDAYDIPSSNIVFLIDVSGSMMDDNKLPLIVDSMELLIENFGKDDRISIVTYASGTKVVLNGERGDHRDKIMNAFRSLRAGGSTNGSGGITLAYETAEENFIEDGVNRVIICSDGDFNVGLTSQSELQDLIEKEKETGVFLSVLGFGMYNFSDTNMETLADWGNGNYAYIDTLNEAKKVLVDEMTSTFVTVAKDVKFQVEFNPATVSEYRLVGYENRAMAAEDFTDDTKDGGELGAGHQVTVLYEIALANGAADGIELKYQDTPNLSSKGADSDEYCTLSIAYKAPDGDTSSYLEFPIGTDNYTKTPSDDFLFAACVAETSLALRSSEFLKDPTPVNALEHVKRYLSDRKDLTDYQEEFEELVTKLEVSR